MFLEKINIISKLRYTDQEIKIETQLLKLGMKEGILLLTTEVQGL